MKGVERGGRGGKRSKGFEGFEGLKSLSVSGFEDFRSFRYFGPAPSGLGLVVQGLGPLLWLPYRPRVSSCANASARFRGECSMRARLLSS